MYNLYITIMNILDQLNKNESESDSSQIITNLPENEINKLINTEREGGNLDNLEWLFVLEFINNIDDSIVNIEWFVKIINKLNNQDLIKLLGKKFKKYFIIEEKLLKFSEEKLIENLINHKKEVITFTNDQLVGIRNIIKFLADNNEKVYGLYGYAGTGKTTTLVEFISYLIINNYIKRVAFTAPTNKAVNVMKSKFKYYLDYIFVEKIMKNQKYEKAVEKNEFDNYTFDDKITKLKEVNINIDCITIHKLLNYKNDFDNEGERIFIKNKNTNIKNYDLVIIDECSMIQLQVITHILEDIKEGIKLVGNNLKRVPKILFSGDPAQLPPVNERTSRLFVKNDISYEDFIKFIPDSDYSDKMNFVTKEDKAKLIKEMNIRRLDYINEKVQNINNFTLTKVVRNKIDRVVELCFSMREWIDKEIPPKFTKYVGDHVYLYKLKDKSSEEKIKSDWFKKCLESFSLDSNTNNLSNIILTWTNRQSDAYNDAIRKSLFRSKKIIEKFEIGDILMLNDFYMLEGGDTSESDKFYTSEQIKIVDTEIGKKKCPGFSSQSLEYIRKNKELRDIETEYMKIVGYMNNSTIRDYGIWELTVNKLSDTYIKNNLPKNYMITVLHSDYNKVWDTEKSLTFSIIKKFRQTMEKKYPDKINSIDRNVINNLWRQYNKIFIEPFAKVDYSFSNTTHKAQGSSFYNVFVDVIDIMANPDLDEAKRCLYTALSRSSNDVHILIPSAK